MKLSRKLILTFTLASGLIAIASFAGHKLLTDTENKVDIITEEISPTVNALQDIRYYSQKVISGSSEMMMHFIMTDGSPHSILDSEYNQARELNLENIVALKLATEKHSQLIQNFFPNELPRANEFTLLTQKLENLNVQISSLDTSQPSNQEIIELHENLGNIDKQLSNAVKLALTNETQELETHHQDIETLLDVSLNKGIATTIASFLIIIFLWVFINKSISKPIARLRRATAQVSAGDLSKKLDITSRDEIGELAHSFNEMVTRLSATTVSKDYTENILRSMAEALFVLDTEGRIKRTNRSALSLLGYHKNELENMHISEVIPEMELNNDLAVNLSGFACLNEKESHLKSKAGKSLTVYLTCSPLNDADDNLQGMILLAHDISARKEAEERLHYLANYDPLTGLSNRAMLFERLADAISRPLGEQQNVGLLLCGLDRFKLINDTLGHEVGDQLLKKMAQLLQGTVHSHDTVARIGGDEFAVVIPNASDANTIRTMAEKIIDTLSGPMLLSDHEVFVTLSIGMSIYPFDGVDPLSLLKNADIALCNAKDKGKNQLTIYADVSGTKSTEHLKLESDLQHALERDEIKVYYQPQIDIQRRRIIGSEALIRWQHRERGLVSPAEFLPIAEETGLIVALGERVLRNACAQTRKWIDQGHHDFKTAINLSDQEFKREDLLNLVHSVLDESGLSANNLELEITENIVMHNPKSAESIMQKVREMGIELSIDDFGTGYSSLAHLKRFPINTVKIDRSFIMDIVDDSDDMIIVEAILAIARKMGLNVIAEGVENSEQQELLRKNGCFQIQGFYYSPPVPAEKFTELLANQEALFSQLEQAS